MQFTETLFNLMCKSVHFGFQREPHSKFQLFNIFWLLSLLICWCTNYSIEILMYCFENGVMCEYALKIEYATYLTQFSTCWEFQGSPTLHIYVYKFQYTGMLKEEFQIMFLLKLLWICVCFFFIENGKQCVSTRRNLCMHEASLQMRTIEKENRKNRSEIFTWCFFLFKK